MLSSAKELQSCSIYAAEGDIGDVEAVYFDDGSWKVRYLMAKIGGMLVGCEVLIAPEFVEAVDREARVLRTGLTEEQLKNSPGVETDRPVADQQEAAHYDHYGAPPYWRNGWEPAGGAAVPAYTGAYLPVPGPIAESASGETSREERGDPHLRSTREVAGYHVGATDVEVGHVEDFVVDDGGWAIRYLVVDTRNWLPGKKVLVSPLWVSGVSWPERKVYMDLESAEIKTAPQWDPDVPIDREYEVRLHEHYGRPPYWVYR